MQKKSPKVQHNWNDTITEQVLMKEQQKINNKAKVQAKGKLDLDMHMKLREQRKILDNYGDDKFEKGSIHDLQSNFNLSPREFQKLYWQKEM